MTAPLVIDSDGRKASGSKAERLAFLAILAAIEAAPKRGKFTQSAAIPWRLIEEIRAELEAAGFDWPLAVRRRMKLERDARKAERDSR